MVEVAWCMSLSTDTLFLAVQVMDRYLSAANVPRARLQLLAITSLWVAAKYEEAAAPRSANFLAMASGNYTLAELLSAEESVLKVLEHRLSVPTIKTFLRRYMYQLEADRQLYFMASYLAEISLLDYAMLAYLPSQVAAAVYVWALVLTGHALILHM
eukprot:jgi/Chrzof1/14234/Cz08g30160.t1